MIRLLIHWFLSALSLIIVAHLVPGFHLSGIGYVHRNGEGGASCGFDLGY